MKLIEIKPLNKGHFAKVDDEDYDALVKFRWTLNGDGYAQRYVRVGGKSVQIKMHREVNQTPDDRITDHLNGDRLDNRKSNLRSVVRAENNRNVSVHTRKRLDLPLGVGWDRQKQRYTAEVTINCKRVFRRYCRTVEEAEAILWEARKRFGIDSHYTQARLEAQKKSPNSLQEDADGSISLSNRIDALRQAGFGADVDGDGRLWAHFPVYGPTELVSGEDNPWAEVSFRAAVMQRATTSYAEFSPAKKGWDPAVIVHLRDDRRKPAILASSASGPTYYEAWLEALIRLIKEQAPGGED